jgi:hypothetical protein
VEVFTKREAPIVELMRGFDDALACVSIFLEEVAGYLGMKGKDAGGIVLWVAEEKRVAFGSLEDLLEGVVVEVAL